MSCGKKITEYNDSIGEGGSQSGKEEGTNGLKMDGWMHACMRG